MLCLKLRARAADKPGKISVDEDFQYELESTQTAQISKAPKLLNSPSTFNSEFSSGRSDIGQRDTEIDYPQSNIPDETTQEEGFQQAQLILLAIGLSLIVFLISLDRVIITTAIPHITYEFSSSSDMGWYGSAYLITACAFQPVYGRIFTMCSMKWTYLASLCVFEVGSLLSAAAPDSTSFIIGRAVAGYGSAGLLTGSFVIVANTVPMPKRPFYTSFVGAIFAFGATIGPLIGGLFTDLLSWRWCFYINLPIGAITAIIFLVLFWRVPSDKGTMSLRDKLLNLDLVGNLLLIGSAVMLFTSIEFTAQGIQWSDPRVVGMMTGFGVTSIVFIAWQWYMQDKALVPPSIIKQRTVAASSATAFVIYGALLLHAYFLPIWFQAIRGANALQSGVNMLPYFIVSAFFSMLGGAFVSAVGYFVPPALMGAALATIGAGLLTMLSMDTKKSEWAGFEIIAAAGFGLVIQQGFTAVQATLPKEQSSIGTALIVCFQSLGGAVFISVGNSVLHGTFRAACEQMGLPKVDFQHVISHGITAAEDRTSPKYMEVLLRAYNDSLSVVLHIPILLAGLAFVFSLFLEWKSVKTTSK